MTIETEGLTPEPSVPADVNTQEKPVVTDAADEGGEGNAEDAEPDIDDEQFEKLLKSKRLQKHLQTEVDTKTSRQKAANRQLQKQYEDTQAELQKLKTAKPLQKPVLEDFKTMEEYQDALADHKAEEKFREKQEKEAEQRMNESQQARLAEQRTSFLGKEAEVIKADPEYHANTAVVQEFIDLLPKNQNGVIEDPGYRAFCEFIATGAENGPALLNHLGKNPDKIESLFGKPAAWITKKLAQYEKEIEAKPKIPEKQPLPRPPTGIKGSSRAEKSVEDMSADDLLKSIRS